MMVSVIRIDSKQQSLSTFDINRIVIVVLYSDQFMLTLALIVLDVFE
jgi:hypothetical protein